MNFPLASVTTFFIVLQQYLPFTVLKQKDFREALQLCQVATVLTVYGIETNNKLIFIDWFFDKLQQYLPFTVLKLFS